MSNGGKARWKKAYRGPFTEKGAAMLAEQITRNKLLKAKKRPRRGEKGLYDVYVEDYKADNEKEDGQADDAGLPDHPVSGDRG